MGQEPTLKTLGPYRLDQHLATGGMAEVFVATRVGPHGFEKRVALKRMLPQFARHTDLVEMFINEARLAARLEHPNIVQVFDFGEVAGELFLAMELVDGTNVSHLLRAVASRDDAVPLDAALYIAQQTAHALACAHAMTDDEGNPLSIVHRDVSPANILLTRSGHVKLSDFGIACIVGADRRTEDGHVRGKLGYMSPEQVLGKDLQGRSDVFTLAVVLAEMLIGEPLFGTGNDLDILIRIRDANLKVLDASKRVIPRDVLTLLQAGLMRDARQRPTSASFAEALDGIIRRRGKGTSRERVARLLTRLELVGPSRGDENSVEPGAKNTSLLDTTGVSDTDALVGQLDLTSPSIYRVRLATGETVGPVSFPRLVQMITEGLVTSNTLISKESGTFERAIALPELTRFVTSPAFQWSAQEVANAGRQGILAPGGLLAVAHRIVSQRETGVLHLQHGDKRKKIYFVEGRPEFVGSTEKSELLGEYLIRNGMALRMEVEMALAILPRFGGRLGDAMVGLGVLRPVQLFRAISGQVRERFLEAFRWQDGCWAFAANIRSHEETFPLGHDVNELLRDAAMQVDGSALESVLQPLRDRVLVRAPSPTIPLSAYRVPHDWQRLLESLRGDRTFGHVIARAGETGPEGREVAHRAVHLGLSCRIVQAA